MLKPKPAFKLLKRLGRNPCRNAKSFLSHVGFSISLHRGKKIPVEMMNSAKLISPMLPETHINLKKKNLHVLFKCLNYVCLYIL